MARTAVQAEARLRAKSQLTLPEPIVMASGLAEGDRFLVELSADDPDTIRLHRIRASYAGALTGVYEDVDDYLDRERRSWERP